jgi:hypothetical protein
VAIRLRYASCIFVPFVVKQGRSSRKSLISMIVSDNFNLFFVIGETLSSRSSIVWENVTAPRKQNNMRMARLAGCLTLPRQSSINRTLLHPIAV